VRLDILQEPWKCVELYYRMVESTQAALGPSACAENECEHVRLATVSGPFDHGLRIQHLPGHRRHTLGAQSVAQGLL
jgi:hypothetical protein